LESPATTAQKGPQIDLTAQPSDHSEFSALLRAIEPQLDHLSLLDIVQSAKPFA